MAHGDIESQKGKRTIIADHCQQRLSEGPDPCCVFLCFQRGRRYYATDIPIIDGTFGLDRLRKESGGWWKRYSLYSAIGVREVNMRLMRAEGFIPNQHRVQVCIEDIDYTVRAAGYEAAKERAFNKTKINCDCSRFEPDGMPCGPDLSCTNIDYDQFHEEEYCPVQEYTRLCQSQSDTRWIPAMLKYYWQNGIDEKAVQFLTRSGFVHKYEYLQYNQGEDAASPYGKEIPAFLLIEGWHVRKLLILIGASLSGSGVIVSVVAALSRDLEVTLTAGSYVCAVAAVLLAGFTLLSAIL